MAKTIKWEREDFTYFNESNDWRLQYVFLYQGKIVKVGNYRLCEYREYNQKERKPIEMGVDEYNELIESAMKSVIRDGKIFDQFLIGRKANLVIWERDYNDLEAKEKWLLQVVRPFAFKTRIKQTVRVFSAVTLAYEQLEKAGFVVECKSCGGSGVYSRTLKWGAVCFNCNGDGTVFPRMTKKFKREVEQHFFAKWKKKYGEYRIENLTFYAEKEGE
jgi:hypothetical protein